eukprot:5990800-Pyramimonas_sp.AAC.1
MMDVAEALSVLNLTTRDGCVGSLTRGALRTAYRRQAFLHHPDKNHGSPASAARYSIPSRSA